MAIFAVTFRIHSDATYETRYQSVVDAIKKIALAGGGKYWDETTSFLLLECDKSSADLASSIDAASLFSGNKDLLVAINLTQKGYKIIGKYTDADIDDLMKRR